MGWFHCQAQEEVSVDLAEADIHTVSHPYCSNLNCWCHTDVEHHTTVQNTFEQQTEEEEEQAFSFFGIGRRGGGRA